MLEADADGDGALVSPVVVLGRPGFAVPAVDEGHGFVGDEAGRREAVLQGGGVEEGLDGRTRLPRRLDGPVELAVAVGIAADEGPDLSRLGVDGDEAAVPDGLLVEGNQGLFRRFIVGGHLDLDDVAALDERVEGFGLRPADVLAGHLAERVLDPDRGFVPGNREYNGIVDIARLDRLILPAQQPLVLQPGLGGGDEAFQDLGAGREDVRLVGAPAVHAVFGLAQPRLEGPLRVALEGRVEGGEDLEPRPVEAVVAVVFLEVAPDLLEEVGAEFRARPPQGQDVHRPPLGRFALGPGQVAFYHHPVEDMVAAVEGAHLVRIRGIKGRATEDAGDEGRFLEAEIGEVLAEKEIGRGLDAVSAVAQEKVVAVELEDLLLGIELLDLARKVELLELAAKADLPVEEEVPGQLLRDGAAALGATAAQDLEHVGPDGPQDTAQVHTTVAKEARVLGGHDRVDEGLGYPVVSDFDAPLLGEFLDRPAVGGVDRGDELGPERVDVGDLRQIVLDGDVGAGEGSQADGQSGQDGDEECTEYGALLEFTDLDLKGGDLHAH